MAKQTQLTNEELAAFCSQVSILLHAGVAPVESMRILLSDTTDPASKHLLHAILDSIMQGNSFADSLDAVGVFPDYVVNTIRLGEEAGSTDEVMRSLADYYDREAQIAESIKSAVTYPLIMIAMMVLVIIILITKVLPIFNQVFIQLGSEMTGFGASLLNLGTKMNRYSIGIIAFIVLLFALYLFFGKTTRGKELSKHFLATFFLTKSFYADVAVGRFASGMALALTAGLDTFASLDMVSKLCEHKKVQEKIAICRSSIQEGDNFAEGLKKAQMFSNVNNRMVTVGFKTGEIEKVMGHIADEYERKSEKKMNDIISIIEPTLVIILSVIVGLILLSVILPLMGIMSSIG